MVFLAVFIGLLAALLLWPLRVGVKLAGTTFKGRVRWLGVGFDTNARTYSVVLGTWVIHQGRFGAEKSEFHPAKKKQTGRKLFYVTDFFETRSGFTQSARYFFGHLHVEQFDLELVIATPDPALTGELFGYGLGLRSALAPFVNFKNIRLSADFFEDWPRVWLELELRTRLIHLLVVGLRVFWIMRHIRPPKPKQVKRWVRVPA